MHETVGHLASSVATDLVANLPDNRPFGEDVFLRDMQTQSTTLLSINSSLTDTGNHGSIKKSPAGQYRPSRRRTINSGGTDMEGCNPALGGKC